MIDPEIYNSLFKLSFRSVCRNIATYGKVSSNTVSCRLADIFCYQELLYRKPCRLCPLKGLSACLLSRTHVDGLCTLNINEMVDILRYFLST